MDIRNSSKNDMNQIFELYALATEYMKSKNQVAWPEFSREMVSTEIKESRQWKLLIDNKIACIWATTLNDDLIWGANNDKAIYIHRIATNPFFRGRKLVSQIVNWAEQYCLNENLKFIRMDTVGLNEGLIGHYEKFGFVFLGTKKLKNTEGLPSHYKQGPVCLFERKMTNANIS